MLVLSLIALFAGPLLYQWMRHGGFIARAFDRILVVVLVLVVIVLLLPEALEGLGWSAVALIAAGYLVPGLLEASVKKSAHTFHLVSVLFGLAGIALHAMLDGAGLAGSQLVASNNLALAIILHRLGVGLALWLIVQPAFGRRMALLVLSLIGAATVLGYSLSEIMLPLAGKDSVLIIQALIIGTIIHSLVHREHVAKH